MIGVAELIVIDQFLRKIIGLLIVVRSRIIAKSDKAGTNVSNTPFVTLVCGVSSQPREANMSNIWDKYHGVTCPSSTDKTKKQQIKWDYVIMTCFIWLLFQKKRLVQGCELVLFWVLFGAWFDRNYTIGT